MTDALIDTVTGKPVGHVYDGPTDARQGTAEVKPTRFRPRYRAMTGPEMAVHDRIKAMADELELLYAEARSLQAARDTVTRTGAAHGSRYNSLAITALEESVMWAIKDLTS